MKNYWIKASSNQKRKSTDLCIWQENANKAEVRHVKVNVQNPQNMKTTVNALAVNKTILVDVMNISSGWIKSKMKKMSLWHSDNNRLSIDILIGADS